ncbi:MAG: GldG family protein [Candidatus Methylomirabilis sp.]|nr:GldG family protein [Deltaproteobacteria bacterium]
MNKKLTQVAGLAGLIMFAFSGLVWAMTGDASPYVLVNLFGGLALLGVYFSTNFGAFAGGLTGRGTRFGANSALYSVGVLAALVAVNFIVKEKDVRKDLTANKIHSLSDKSLSILGELDQDLEIYGFYQEGEGQDFDDLADMYGHASKRLAFQKVNPEHRPDLAERYEVTAYGSIIVAPKEGANKVKIEKATEEDLTNAIVKVAGTEQKTIYFLTGHDEGSLEDQDSAKGLAMAKKEVEGENYKVQPLQLASPDYAIPADCAALVVAGPQRQMLAEELKAVDDYLAGGGKALFLVDANTASGLEGVLAKYGVQVGADAIIGIQAPSAIERLLNPNARPAPTLTQAIRNFGTHKIVEDFRQPVVLQVVRSVRPAADARGLAVTTLGSTEGDSWAETDLVRLFTQSEAQQDDGELQGPISVAVAVEGGPEGAPEGTSARFVVVGDADFATNKYLYSVFNRDFLLNAINWTVGETERVAIGPRVAKASSVDLTGQDLRKIFYFGVLLAPQALLIAGLGVWWMRR